MVVRNDKVPTYLKENTNVKHTLEALVVLYVISVDTFFVNVKG